MFQRSTLAFLSLCVLAPIATADEGARTPAEAINGVFADLIGQQGPGCAVGVAEGADLIHAAGYGFADLEYDIPLDADSVFRMASVSKQFTAIAVALAAEDGLIDLDAGIGTYLPELHESVQGATVRQVIGHIGGLPDYESQELNNVLRDAMGNPFTFGAEDHLSTEEFFEVTRFVEQKHVPGTVYEYSNIGYFWLGQIVERVTGERLRDFAARRIFGPAGMTSSQFNDDTRRIVPRRAGGYGRSGDDQPWQIFETNLDWVGEGGVYTSVNDFAHWNEQFRNPTLGADPAALRAMLNRPASDVLDEDGEGYGFGLASGTDANGRDYIAHSGGWVAFRTYFKRFPDEDLAYWVFCNRPDGNPAGRGAALEAVLLP